MCIRDRHYDEFHLFRPGTPDIPSWYKAPNYHQTDVYGVNLNVQYISRLGITRFGGEFRNEGVLSSNLGKPMRQPRDNYTMWDNRSDIGFFAEDVYKRQAERLAAKLAKSEKYLFLLKVCLHITTVSSVHLL